MCRGGRGGEIEVDKNLRREESKKYWGSSWYREVTNPRPTIRSYNPNMAIVFYAQLYGRFIETKSSLGRKEIHRAIQSYNFLGDSFSNREDVPTPIQLRRKRQPQHLKRWFFLKSKSIFFTSIAPVLPRPVKRKLSCSALKSASHFLTFNLEQLEANYYWENKIRPNVYLKIQ